MNAARFGKLKHLAEIREVSALSRLENARRFLREETAALEYAKKALVDIEAQGRDAINQYMQSLTATRGYSSALTKLRALTAQVDEDMRSTQNFIEEKVQSIADAEMDVEDKKRAYLAAHQKLEKMTILSDKIQREEQKLRGLSQEADSLDRGSGGRKSLV